MLDLIKKGFICFVLVIGILVAAAAGYCGYIILSYDRIGNIDLEVEGRTKNNVLRINTTYTAVTYNIGFGAYSQDYTFFLDTGYDIDGNETCGYYSTCKSEEEANFNVDGSVSTISSLDPTFVLLQEVDIDSTRSYGINQNERFVDALTKYQNVFAYNYDTAYLPYPLYDMHGSVKAGLSTFSKYTINDAYRCEYTISDDLSKLFDIDRCFSVSVLEVENGKKLYLVNSHMSAYDKGGIIREKQMQELNAFLEACKYNGDYVIVGGDFNHDLLTNNPNYDYNSYNRPFGNYLKDPDWVAPLFDEYGNSPLVDGYTVVASDDVPTCRNNDIEWEPGITYTCVVDGFIISDNIELEFNTNISTDFGNKEYDGFAYSDHQPAYIGFYLKTDFYK